MFYDNKHYFNFADSCIKAGISVPIVAGIKPLSLNVGIEWATKQSEELIKVNVPAIHYYTMGKPDNIVKICSNVGF